ncbi:hypothetical protein TURU_092297 [Turdus rufiventris]|nr:hypothetical protein TURU_092297 [Turdus rufiventris]
MGLISQSQLLWIFRESQNGVDQPVPAALYFPESQSGVDQPVPAALDPSRIPEQGEGISQSQMLWILPESQNRVDQPVPAALDPSRIPEQGEGISQSQLLPRQGHLEQVTQAHSQVGPGCLSEMDTPHPPWAVFPVLCYPQHEEILPCIEVEFPVLIRALVPSLGTAG